MRCLNLSIYIPENGNIGFIPRILGKNIFIEKIFHYSKFNGKIQEGDLILAVNRSIVGVQIDCQQAVKQINQAEYRLDLTVATEPDAKIPASKAAEHMKDGLLDSRLVEERDKQISQKQSEEIVYAPGQSIESSLRQLAERRTDIFGVGDEAVQENMIGRKMGEEEARPDPKIWDGHATSAENAAREARGNASLDDQIAQIHRQKGLNQAPPPPQPPKPIVVAPPAPQPVAMVPPVAPMIVGVPVRPAMVVPAPVFAPAPAPPVFMHQGQMMDDDEPAAKRSRTEENLIPEGEFLARNHSPVTMKVSVPNMPDKAEWKLEGQMLTITLGLTETVNSIKSKIMEEIGMPQGKQKLQHESIFLKDANSLAYYNIMPGTVLNLQLKERGGRKK